MKASDNGAIAELIKEVLSEFRADKPGTAYFDENLDRLCETFTHPGAGYWVVEQNKMIIGGGGIYPTKGLPEGYCELVKVYLHKNARGAGAGTRLMEVCISAAQNAGYTHIYLETLPELHQAVQFYQRSGFKFLTQPLGQSGHFNCSIWMLLNMNEFQKL